MSLNQDDFEYYGGDDRHQVGVFPRLFLGAYFLTMFGFRPWFLFVAFYRMENVSLHTLRKSSP